MNNDRFRDSANDAVDRARDTAEGLLSSARSRLKSERLNGELRHAADRAESAYTATMKSLEGSTRERPLPALAIALGIGFVIGLLSLRRD